MFIQRQFQQLAPKDKVFEFSETGNIPFDWDDLSNNSTTALHRMCKLNDINVEPPFLKRTMITLLKEYLETNPRKDHVPLYPIREHVTDLKLDYATASVKNVKPVTLPPSRSSASSVTSDSYSLTSASTPTVQTPSETPQIKAPPKNNIMKQLKNAIVRPRKFINDILATPIQQQRDLFHILLMGMHVLLFIVYLVSTGGKLQKPPRYS